MPIALIEIERSSTVRNRRMKALSITLLMILMVSLATAEATAQAGGTQQQTGGFTNLQVWPKDSSRAVIMQFMNAFDDSLGITCDYCHVQRDGKFDYASDDKREKRVARQMVLLRD